jgi:transposase-like protein
MVEARHGHPEGWPVAKQEDPTMAKKNAKRYTGRFKFQVVLEVLSKQKDIGQVARAYGVHPVTLGLWKKDFLERGPEVFGGSEVMREYERRIRELERLLGQKEVEIALLKNFLTEN